MKPSYFQESTLKQRWLENFSTSLRFGHNCNIHLRDTNIHRRIHSIIQLPIQTGCWSVKYKTSSTNYIYMKQDIVHCNMTIQKYERVDVVFDSCPVVCVCVCTCVKHRMWLEESVITNILPSVLPFLFYFYPFSHSPFHYVHIWSPY
jgi:hypothetical protein